MRKKAAPNKKKAARPVLNVPPRGIGPITNPNENDVLCGRRCRRGGINSHLGNVQFRDIIHSQKSEYLDPSTKRDEKAHIATRIVSDIRTMDPAGRFLMEDQGTGMWFDIGDAKAISKTGHALREKKKLVYMPRILPVVRARDSPLPDKIFSNAMDEIYITDQPIESFHYQHQASSKLTVRPPITVSCDEFQFLCDQEEKMVKDENLEEEVDIDHDYAIDVPDLIIKKKKWDRTIEHNKLDNYFADPDLFFEGNCNGDYPNLKMAADPDDTSGITLLDGSRVPQEIIDNVFLPGGFMLHITPACNLRNYPRDRTRFYDLTEHGALEGGILQHGLKRFTTIEGHKEESHINGVWMLPGSRIKPGIQHVCKNHNNDLMYSNNKVAVVICRKDDPELKKLRPFPLCSTWARSTHPAYSLENMEVNPEFIFIVDT